MSDLVDQLTRLNLTAEELRQAVVQAVASNRATQGASGSPAGGSPAGGGARSGAASGGQGADLAGQLSGKLGEQLGSSLTSGVSGLGSFGKSQISEGLGGGLGGSAAGSAFQLFLKGVADVTQGENAAIRSTPLFSGQAFVDQSKTFGAQRGFNNFFGNTLGLNNFTNVIEEDNRKIDERQAALQTPTLRAAENLSGLARQIGEQGGDVTSGEGLEGFRQMIPYELARQQRGFDNETAVRAMVTQFGATNPSSSLQLRRG